MVHITGTNVHRIVPSVGTTVPEPFFHNGTPPNEKQCLTNVRQGNDKNNMTYLEWVDKLILEGETLGDKTKVLGEVGGLKVNTKLWKLMNTQ